MKTDHRFSKIQNVGSNYILQRMIGHTEIDAYDKKKSRINFEDIVADSFKSDNKVDTSSQASINKHFSKWIEADDCWICQKHRYFIPMFLQSEVNDGNINDLTPVL
jgi:hypothetical protein